MSLKAFEKEFVNFVLEMMKYYGQLMLDSALQNVPVNKLLTMHGMVGILTVYFPIGFMVINGVPAFVYPKKPFTKKGKKKVVHTVVIYFVGEMEDVLEGDVTIEARYEEQARIYYKMMRRYVVW